MTHHSPVDLPAFLAPSGLFTGCWMRWETPSQPSHDCGPQHRPFEGLFMEFSRSPQRHQIRKKKQKMATGRAKNGKCLSSCLMFKGRDCFAFTHSPSFSHRPLVLGRFFKSGLASLVDNRSEARAGAGRTRSAADGLSVQR